MELRAEGYVQSIDYQQNKSFTIGLFGFGAVGKGIYELLTNNTGLSVKIGQIAVRDTKKNRAISPKYFTATQQAILNDPEIDLIIEVIDDAQAAYEIVTTALKNGKAVVSANKKMIAEHLEELLELQRIFQTPFLYEAAVCGSIPIIRNLDTFFSTEMLSKITTICNGTTNYILSKTAEGITYHQALKSAQQLGFAESDPTLDVQGFDAKYKLVILLLHAFGQVISPEKILNYGIQNLNIADTLFAKKGGYTIKLLAKAYRKQDEVIAYVGPHFVKATDRLVTVQEEDNAVEVVGQFGGQQFFIGKGAGSHPTALAVLSDVAALSRDYRYAYAQLEKYADLSFQADALQTVYLRYSAAEDLMGLDFKKIIEQQETAEFSYLIGEIALSNLITANLNDRPEVFLAFF